MTVVVPGGSVSDHRKVVLAEKSIYAIAKTERPQLRRDSFLDAADLLLSLARLCGELLVARLKIGRRLLKLRVRTLERFDFPLQLFHMPTLKLKFVEQVLVGGCFFLAGSAAELGAGSSAELSFDGMDDSSARTLLGRTIVTRSRSTSPATSR